MSETDTPPPPVKRKRRRKPRKRPPPKQHVLKKSTRTRLLSRTFLTALVMAASQGINKFAPGEISWYGSALAGLIATGALGWFAADEKTRT